MLVLLGSVTIAVAQGAAGMTKDSASGKPELTPAQRSAITRGLSNQPAQSSDMAAQPQAGSKMPSSLNAQAMPTDVGDQVPEAKSYLFVKLPDRVLLIDPDTRMVAEILLDTDSGSAGGGPSGNNPR
jgi:hypothetical protein